MGDTTRAWWIEGFTDGADPEYEEQILPAAAAELAGARRVLDVGCGEGQIARLAAGLGAQRRRHRSDLGPRQRRPASVAAARRTSAPKRRRCRSPTAPSMPSWRVWCSSTSATSTTPSPKWPACCRAGGRFSFFLNHPLLQTPNSGWIDDHLLDPPEQYWRIGAYLVEEESDEEVEKDVFIPFIHRPLSRYVNALAENGLLIERM